MRVLNGIACAMYLIVAGCSPNYNPVQKPSGYDGRVRSELEENLRGGWQLDLKPHFFLERLIWTYYKQAQEKIENGNFQQLPDIPGIDIG